MNEIEKMYKNAGAKADRIVCYRGFDNCIDNDFNCHCHNEKPCKDATKIYPPFTAEKQLALLKLLIRHSKTELYCRYANDKYKLIMYTEDCCTSDIDSFENALASVVCDVWGLLTPEEKQQVRNILNE